MTELRWLRIFTQKEIDNVKQSINFQHFVEED